jgi:hypothetical protein
MQFQTMMKMTDEQWATWDAKTITIPVTMFDGLLDCLALVVEGRRLKSDQRENWVGLQKQALPILFKAEGEVLHPDDDVKDV